MGPSEGVVQVAGHEYGFVHFAGIVADDFGSLLALLVVQVGVGGDKYELVEFEFYRGPTFIAGQVGYIAAFDRQVFLHQCSAAYAAVFVEGLGIAIEVGIVETRALGDVA